MPAATTGDYIFFTLVNSYLKSQIAHFQEDVLGRMSLWVSTFAVILVTLWIMIQGYRMVTGQTKEPMMALVANMAKIVFIVSVATSLAVAGNDIQELLTTDLGKHINFIFTGSASSPDDMIDKNLAKTQLALSAIDIIRVNPTDIEMASEKGRAELMATFGTASPPMTAGAMLLLYQFAMALFIGLGPLFILCLIFEQTKELFRKWLMYGLGTLFSMAMLSVVTAIAMRLCLSVAEALWAANMINSLTGQPAEGLSSLAMQQGGIGLLMTVLIVSVPPMAAMFFQGTMGNALTYSAMGGANTRPGEGGQPAGSYAPRPTHNSMGDQRIGQSPPPPGLGVRTPGAPVTASADQVKTSVPTRET
ncbi:type IV secretion system protein [Dyella marensis]|uniref:Type IV secretion system protein VirB6 n=1 Tax=Dyella marensis TaxID=500610 RepID=A0A1I2HJA0_9GAMM|nr:MULTISPECIES: type IV secretion system protein [Dyella]SFF29598.1 type IV secretion system protein VirB6 [Dyella marensis]